MNAINQFLFPFWNLSPADPWWLIQLAFFTDLHFPKLALALLLVFGVVDADRWRATAVQMALAIALAWLAARGIHAWFPMPRPVASGMGHQWIAHSSSSAFPSTHASVALAFGLVGWLSAPRRWVGAVCVIVGMMIAWSRVALGVHFPMDVFGGAVVAAVAALGVHVLWRIAQRPVSERPGILIQRRAQGLQHDALLAHEERKGFP